MRATPENSRKSGMDLSATSAFFVPPVSSTTFTERAYDASRDRDRSAQRTGLWAMICFICGTLFGFRGRVSRLDYWVIGMAYTFTSIVGYFAFAQAVGSLKWGDITSATQDLGFVFRFLTFCFVMLMLRLSLEARRFQDRGLSGYWYFGYLIPVLNVYLFVTNSIFPGTQGANKYDL